MRKYLPVPGAVFLSALRSTISSSFVLTLRTPEASDCGLCVDNDGNGRAGKGREGRKVGSGTVGQESCVGVGCGSKLWPEREYASR